MPLTRRSPLNHLSTVVIPKTEERFSARRPAPRARRKHAAFAAALCCCLLTAFTKTRARAETVIWQCGAPDDSSAEFTRKAADSGANGAASIVVQAPANSVRIAPELAPPGLNGKSAPSLEIDFNLTAPPRYGAMFSFKLLDAPASGAEMAVFANREMAGQIQLWGTSGTASPYKWRRTYRLYIPWEMLRQGANSLRLVAEHPLWSDASDDSRVWLEWDYLKLAALDRQATEPIHGSLVYLGTTLKHGDFKVNDDTLSLARYALPWLGIAYSGNTVRADFWYDVASQQPRRLEYLKLLRDLNMSVVVDNVSGSHFHNDASGRIPTAIKKSIGKFFADYGSLFQYYELGNEPCMFGGGFDETIALAHQLNRIKPPTVRIAACGWAYGGGKGTPINWDADPARRREVEALTQMTNGHSYGFSYADNRGGSFIENLNTFGGVEDGWPREYLNTETGANDWHSEENGPHIASSQPHAQAFDRILRAHIAVVDRTMQHAAIFDDFGLFQMPASFSDLGALTAQPGVAREETHLQTFRRLALAYATHGAPLPYRLLNSDELQDRRVYIRAVDTGALSPLPGSRAASDKVLLNIVNFENDEMHVRVRFTLPKRERYVGDRFGPGLTYAEAHRRVELVANPTTDIDVTVPPRDSVQYIVSSVGAPSQASAANPAYILPIGPPAWIDSRFGDRSAVVMWGASPGANGYRVFRARGFGGEYVPIARTSRALLYQDADLKNGVVYRYRISARYGKRWSALSDSIGVVPNAPHNAEVDSRPATENKTTK